MCVIYRDSLLTFGDFLNHSYLEIKNGNFVHTVATLGQRRSRHKLFGGGAVCKVDLILPAFYGPYIH